MFKWRWDLGAHFRGNIYKFRLVDHANGRRTSVSMNFFCFPRGTSYPSSTVVI